MKLKKKRQMVATVLGGIMAFNCVFPICGMVVNAQGDKKEVIKELIHEKKSTDSNQKEKATDSNGTVKATDSNAIKYIVNGFRDFDMYGYEPYMTLEFNPEEKENLVLPEAIELLISGKKGYIKENVEWKCEDDFLNTEYETYTFKMELPDGYGFEKQLTEDLKTGVATLPWIEVESNDINNYARSGFTPRLTMPTRDNQYFYSNKNIFYASNIKTCTWYAWGRAYEILGRKPALCTAPAECWYDYNINGKRGGGHLPYGNTPRLGAIACWGYTENDIGHVAVVEKIVGNEVTLSEAGTSTDFHISKMTPNGGYISGWNNSNRYAFRGYIYIGDFGNVKPPKIVSANISSINDAGYQVEAFVEEGDASIDRVQFPTWTINNGQDDLPADWSTSEACKGTWNGYSQDGTLRRYLFWVTDKEHYFEKGEYATHIYVFDKEGGQSNYYGLPIQSIANEGKPWKTKSQGGHTYELFLDNLTWDGAKKFCEGRGGHLVTITSDEEQKLVEDLCYYDWGFLSGAGLNTNCFRDFYYIGGNILNEKVSWITGEKSSYAPQWAEGEPNNDGNQETALSVHSEGYRRTGGKWNDISPNSTICGFICEIDPILVNKVELSNTSLSLERGTTKKLTAAIYPSNAYDKKVIFTTSNAGIATVDSSGVITAKSVGTVLITAQAGDKTAVCQVTVKNPAIAVAEIELNQGNVEINSGEVNQLTATVRPDNASDKNVKWESSNSQVAEIDSSGKITGIAPGIAVITAKAGDKTAVCQVTVRNPVIVVEKVELSQSSVEIKVGESSQLTATIRPDNASDKTMSWEVSDSSVATVDSNGNVVGISDGVTTVVVTAGGKKAFCNVTIIVKSSGGGSSGGGSGGSSGGGGSSSGGPGGGGSGSGGIIPIRGVGAGNNPSQPNQISTLPEQVMSGSWEFAEQGWRLKKPDGAYAANQWANINGRWYLMGPDSYMRTGWQNVNNAWYYMNQDGSMATGWALVGGKWYYLADSGSMVSGWILDNGRWYYLNPDGSMATGHITVDGKEYEMGNDGAMK